MRLKLTIIKIAQSKEWSDPTSDKTLNDDTESSLKAIKTSMIKQWSYKTTK